MALTLHPLHLRLAATKQRSAFLQVLGNVRRVTADVVFEQVNLLALKRRGAVQVLHRADLAGEEQTSPCLERAGLAKARSAAARPIFFKRASFPWLKRAFYVAHGRNQQHVDCRWLLAFSPS